jgi:hypothetical protein
MIYLHGPKPFDDLLDEITKVSDDDQMRIEARVERLERIVQTLLLALAEETKPPREEEDDRPGEMIRIPHGDTL